MARRGLAWMLIVACACPAPLLAQQQANGTLAPPPTVDVPASMTEADRQLQDQLTAKVREVTAAPPTPEQISGIANPNLSYTPKDPQGMHLALPDQMGLVLVRDKFVADLGAFQTYLSSYFKDPALVMAPNFADAAGNLGMTSYLMNPDAVKTFTPVLEQAASDIYSIYKTYQVQAVNVDAVARSRWEQLMADADRVEKAGIGATLNGKTAQQLRDDAANTPLGAHLALQRRFFMALDRNPVLGIRLNGKYLFETLMTTEWSSQEAKTTRVADYLLAGVAQAQQGAKDAMAIKSWDKMLQFGSPQYVRQQQAVALGGPFQAWLMSGLPSGYRLNTNAKDADAYITNSLVDLGLGLVAGGSILIPVIGPFIAGGITAIQVIRDGNDLVVSYLDEQQARNAAGVTSYVHVLTAQEKVDAAAGKLVLTAVTGLGDVAAIANIKFMKGLGKEAQELGALRTEAQTLAVDARATNAVSSAVADAGRGGVMARVESGAAKAKALGLPESELKKVDTYLNAVHANGVGLKEGGPLTEAAARQLIQIDDLEKLVGNARKAGVSESEIQGYIARARRTGKLEGFTDGLAHDLFAAAANKEGKIFIVDKGSVDAFNDLWANASVKPRVIVTDAVNLETVSTHLAFMQAGRPVKWSQQELNALQNLARGAGGDATKMYTFFSGENVYMRLFNDENIATAKAFLASPNAAAIARGEAVLMFPTLPPSVLVDRATGNLLSAERISSLSAAEIRQVPLNYFTAMDQSSPAFQALARRTRQLAEADAAFKEAVAVFDKMAADSAKAAAAIPAASGVNSALSRPAPSSTPVGNPNDTSRIPPQWATDTQNYTADEIPTKIEDVIDEFTTGLRNSWGKGVQNSDGSWTYTSPDGKTKLTGRLVRGGIIVVKTDVGASSIGGGTPQPAGRPAATDAGAKGNTGTGAAGGGVGLAPGAGGNGTMMAAAAPASPANVAGGDRGSLVDPDPGACGVGGGLCESPASCSVGDGCVNVQEQCTAEPGNCSGGGPTIDVSALVKIYQLMMAALASAQAAAGRATLDPLEPTAPGWSVLARGLRHLVSWPRPGTSAGTFEGPAATVEHLAPLTAVELVPRRPERWPQQNGSPAPGTGRGALDVTFVANGQSTGTAFDLQVVDRSGRKRRVAVPEGVVLEPFRAAPKAADRSAARALQSLGAYCLDFAKLPPAAGMLYRVADTATQQKFAPLRSVLQAARQMGVQGLLHPDSDPAGYVDAIKQYAVWAKRERWDLKAFTEAFVDRTRKNMEALKQPWTRDVDAIVRRAAPNRWTDISAVLLRAEQQLRSGARP